MPETYDEKIQRAVNHYIPVYAHLELTYRCNQRCIHCYAMVNQSKKKELSTDEFKQVLDQLADLGTLYLAMTGGEILVREDFFDISHYARKKSFALRLFTNGFGITRKIAEQIADLNPLRIEVSLYGINSEVHDKITKIPGSHSSTMNAIRLMVKMGLKLTIKVPVMRQNISEVQQVKKFAGELGTEFISNPTIVPRGDGSVDNLEYRLNDQELNYYFKNVNSDWYFKQPSQNGTLCGAGKGIMSISPYGEVFPCVQMPIQIGDLRKQSLHEIWHSSQALKQIRAMTLSKIKSCSHCEDIIYCNPCPGLAMVEDGDILVPASESCRQAKIRKIVLTNKKNWQPNPISELYENECII